MSRDIILGSLLRCLRFLRKPEQFDHTVLLLYNEVSKALIIIIGKDCFL